MRCTITPNDLSIDCIFTGVQNELVATGLGDCLLCVPALHGVLACTPPRLAEKPKECRNAISV